MAEASTLKKSAINVGCKLSDFKIVKELGKGSYGTVYTVKSYLDENIYVMKKMELNNLKEKQQKECYREVSILKKVSHPNIIKYYSSFLEKDCLYIIMEYAEGGDLYSLIKHYKRHQKHFEEFDIWSIAFEILNGLDYLHKSNIIHRDIKCLNLFITKDKHIKIGDLGVSTIVSNINALHCTRVGTPLYLSPELVRQIPYDFKVDIWSFGCSLYHLASLDPPFVGDNLIVLGNNIVKGRPKPLPPQYSENLSKFIERMLSKRPEKRPTARESLEMIPADVLEKIKLAKQNNVEIKSRPFSSVGNRVITYNKEETEKDLKNNEKDKPKTIEAPLQPIKEEVKVKAKETIVSQPKDTKSEIPLARPQSSKKGSSRGERNQPSLFDSPKKENEKIPMISQENKKIYPLSPISMSNQSLQKLEKSKEVPSTNVNQFRVKNKVHISSNNNISSNISPAPRQRFEINSEKSQVTTPRVEPIKIVDRSAKVVIHKVSENLKAVPPKSAKNDSEPKLPSLEKSNPKLTNINQNIVVSKPASQFRRIMSSKNPRVHNPSFTNRPLTAGTRIGWERKGKSKSTRPLTAFNSRNQLGDNIINININFYNLDMNKKFLEPGRTNENEETKLLKTLPQTKKITHTFYNLKQYARESGNNDFVFDKIIRTLEQASHCRPMTINDLDGKK